MSLIFLADSPFASTTPRASIGATLTAIITVFGPLQVHDRGDPRIPASIHAGPFLGPWGATEMPHPRIALPRAWELG